MLCHILITMADENATLLQHASGGKLDRPEVSVDMDGDQLHAVDNRFRAYLTAT